MQSTHTPEFTARPCGLQNPWEHFPLHPASPQPQTCLSSAGGGTGIMCVFQSPLISCYKSTVDHCFYQLHLTGEETEAQKREVVYPKPHNSLPY